MTCSPLQWITLYLRIKHSAESGQPFLLIIGMKEKLNKKVHTHIHNCNSATNIDWFGYVILEIKIVWVTLTSLPWFLWNGNSLLVKFQTSFDLRGSYVPGKFSVCENHAWVRFCAPLWELCRACESCMGSDRSALLRAVACIVRCLASLVPSYPFRVAPAQSLWELKMLSQTPRMLLSHHSLKGIQQ